MAAIALAFSAQAAPITFWQNDQHFSVGSIIDPRVGAVCVLSANQRTNSGYARWGFAVGLQAAAFEYSEDGVIFNKPGTLKVQIDNAVPFSASAIANGSNQMQIPLPAIPNWQTLFPELATGHQLHITSFNRTRTFSLDGAQNAILTLKACLESITSKQPSQGGSFAPAPLPPALPEPPPATSAVPQ